MDKRLGSRWLHDLLMVGGEACGGETKSWDGR
jgi:hypothetical protein